jgi:hypothetical protein
LIHEVTRSFTKVFFVFLRVTWWRNIMPNKTVSAAPMSSAPMKYTDDGSVDWGNMWDTFCDLAQEGGPPHRGTLLRHRDGEDVFDPAYTAAAHEIIRGIREVSGLEAYVANPGWLAVLCPTASMARWLAEAILQENVEGRVEVGRGVVYRVERVAHRLVAPPAGE